MDQLTNDKKARDVLKQMETCQFDMPLKVSLIIDDSDDKISHHGTLNVRSEDSTLSNIGKIVSTNISRFNDNDSMKIINNHQPMLHTKSNAKTSRLLTQMDNLSLDLIRIIEFKKYTSNNYNYDTKMYETVRDNYLQFKVNIFNKSYNISSSVIVPLEKNDSFMKTFINRTLAIAQEHSSCAISEKMIKNILSDLILWTQGKIVNTSKNVKRNRCKDIELDQIMVHHEESHCIYRDQSHHLIEKSASVDIPTYKRHLYDKVVTEGEGILLLKRQKIMRTCSENNFEDFNYVRFSKKRDNLEVNPTVYLTTESGDNAIGIPSCNNEPYDEVVFTAHDGSETIMSEKNHNITLNEEFTNSNTFIGQCSVCENFTTYMCLGCEKIYYCSLDCQSKEQIMIELLTPYMIDMNLLLQNEQRTRLK